MVTFAAIAHLGEALSKHRSNEELLGGRNFDPGEHFVLAANLAALQALAEAADAAYERALRIWPAPKMLSREMQELGEKVARVRAGAREEQG